MLTRKSLLMRVVAEMLLGNGFICSWLQSHAPHRHHPFGQQGSFPFEDERTYQPRCRALYFVYQRPPQNHLVRITLIQSGCAVKQFYCDDDDGFKDILLFRAKRARRDCNWHNKSASTTFLHGRKLKAGVCPSSLSCR